MSTKPKGGLGRGLGSLIGPAAGSQPFTRPPETTAGPGPVAVEAVATTEEFSPEPLGDSEADLRILHVSPRDIVENTRQPRTYFDPEALEDLKASILEHGLLQPLVVIEKGRGQYELIAGERRLRASRALGLERIPVIVRPYTDDQKKLELALIENIQRENLNAVEEARAYQALLSEFGLSHDDIAGRVGKGRSTIANALRLLELEDDILEALANGQIMRSHAKTLLAEPVPSRRREIFDELLNGGLTVRQVEARAGVKNRKAKEGKDPNIAALENELRERFGTKVIIDMQGGTGKLSIHFYSREDLKELVKRLNELSS